MKDRVLFQKYFTIIKGILKLSSLSRTVLIKEKLPFLHYTGTLIDLIYKKTTDGIVTYIQEMKLDERLHDVKTILLAGGFSKSSHVINAIKEEFQDDLIISLVDPGIAILKVID